MFTTILVPTDGSALSEISTSAVVEFAKANGSKLIAISVAELAQFPMFSEMGGTTDFAFYEETMLDQAQKNVQMVANAASAAGVLCETLTPQAFSPSSEIIEAAQKFNCDLIWMASHGRTGLSKLFLGSETQKVLALSTIPVLVFRAKE